MQAIQISDQASQQPQSMAGFELDQEEANA